MKGKLVFINNIPKEFIEHEKYIHEEIENLFDSFDLNCEVKIEFVDSMSINEFEISDCAVMLKSVRHQKLRITNSALNSINHDGGRFFHLSIIHEFEHIQDYLSFMNTKLFKPNFAVKKCKDFESKYVRVGFDFWTEVNSYYKTIECAKELDLSYEKIPFGHLVKTYKTTDNLNKKLFYNQNLTLREASKYVDCVDSCVYLCAKFIGSFYAGHSRFPYAKIERDKNYKKVFQILCGFEPKIRRLLKNPYNEKSYDNLFKLGKYICEDVRWKVFKVGLVKYHGRIDSIY